MRRKRWLPIVLAILVALAWFLRKPDVPTYSDSVLNVPSFAGEPFVVINDNNPEFTENELTQKAYEYYSELDSYGRCGYAMACVGIELMPTEERESISSVKPSGWVQAQYSWVDGDSLYNRCHLIGFQLTGENANKQNLITGTRYMNVEGMLPFENMIADYIKETGNHVLYRVTPVYDANNLVARGVQLEAASVEDKGAGICFNVYVYNNQPGVIIDYATGESRAENSDNNDKTDSSVSNYILNTSSKKFHTSTCAQAKAISKDNVKAFSGTKDELLAEGYTAGKCCNP